MSRGTAVILAHTVFEIDNRVRKEAESLTKAGFDVARVGLLRDAGDLEFERTQFGDILRVPKPWERSAAARKDVARTSPGRVSVRRRLRSLAARIAAKSTLATDARHYKRRLMENDALFEKAVACRPDVVIACDLLTLPAGVRLRQETGAMLIYDSHEFATEEHADWSGFRRMLFRSLERRLIREADLVTTVGPVLARELASLHRVPEPVVVFNGPDEVTIHAAPAHLPVRLLFQGGFRPGYGLIELVSGMGRLRGKAILTLQGFGVVEPELRETVSRLGLSDIVVFDGPYDPADVVRIGRDHDVGLIPYPLSNKQFLVATPNKLMDYLGAGLAIATVDAPGITRVVDMGRCGVTFGDSDPQGMFDALEGFVSDPEAVSAAKRESGRLGAEFVWENQWRKVADAIDAALGDSASGT